ncbi:MAG: PLP-dependent aminotransferase family protein [Deinococcales bacterium]
MKIIQLTRGVPADESYPLLEVRECAASVMSDPKLALEAMRYGTGYGFLPLRELLAAQHNLSPEQVLVGNGSLSFVDLLGLILEPNSTVIVEAPTYDRTITLLKRHGVNMVSVPLESDGVNMAAFEAAVKTHKPTLAYLIADFQNPSGATMSLEKRQAVLALAEQHHFFVLEDAPYRPLRYRGTNLPSLFDLNPTKVLQMSSYTKQISPGIRVGTLMGDRTWLAKLAKAANDTYISGAFLGQATAFEFLKRGLLEPQLERLRALYAPRLERMAAALRQNGLHDFLEPDGGFFLSVNLPVPIATLLELSPAAGLALTDGRGFFVDPKDGNTFLRLPFCALSFEEIDEGIKRLAGLVQG